MTQKPLVVCTMLTADRPHMAARAVRSYLSQTYENKILVIYDTGKRAFCEDYPQYSVDVALRDVPAFTGQTLCADIGDPTRLARIVYVVDQGEELPLCELINRVNEVAAKTLGADLIAKWDDDDWSHRLRLVEQVALLFRCGKPVVGYNDMMFLDERRLPCDADCVAFMDQAQDSCFTHRLDCPSLRSHSRVVVYSNPQAAYALGTSLLYEASEWKRFNFPDTVTAKNPRGRGSDTQFVHHFAAKGKLLGVAQRIDLEDRLPRMIATLHGSNHCALPARCALASPAIADLIRETMCNALTDAVPSTA